MGQRCRCERVVREELSKEFPNNKFIGEEESSAHGETPPLTEEPTWLVDPLDGTSNFVHGQPSVCVSIALAQNGKLRLGVVHSPREEETFTAVEGQGAFKEGEAIHVSGTDRAQMSLVGTEIGTKRDDETMSAVMSRLRQVAQATRSIRCLGSCALQVCSVACGRLEAFYEIGFGGPWDCAAAAMILKEAGGDVTDPMEGRPFHLHARRILATNGKVATSLQRLLADASISTSEPPPPPTGTTDHEARAI